MTATVVETTTNAPADQSLTAEERLSLVELMGRDIVKFSEYVCKDVVTGAIPEFHREMYDMALSSDRVLIAAPRGFSKSTILARIYPLWLVVYGLRRDILIISASEGLAIENLRYVKTAIETNVLLRYLFGDMTSEKWRENHIELVLRDGRRVTVRAKGAGGQIRGFRPDCIILDDLETDDSVESEEQRKKLKDWVFKACLNCLLPGGQMIVIGTILSQLSLLQDLLESPNEWNKRKYKAVLDDGSSLWEEERPKEWLKARKAEIGSHRFSAEYLNDPMSDEDAPIKAEQIRYWRVLPNDLSAVITIDPAYSEDAKSDFKVAALVGIDRASNRYLLSYIRTHAPTGEFMQAVFNMWHQYKHMVMAVGVPNSGPEKEFFRSFVAKSTEMNVYLPVVELKNAFVDTSSGVSVRNKKRRIIAALQRLFEMGKYYIGENHHEAREELLTIHNARWDDICDCCCYAEQLLVAPVEGLDGKERDWGAESNMVGACEGYGIEY